MHLPPPLQTLSKIVSTDVYNLSLPTAFSCQNQVWDSWHITLTTQLGLATLLNLKLKREFLERVLLFVSLKILSTKVLSAFINNPSIRIT